MKSLKRNLIAAAAMFAALQAPAHAQGIPVLDAANLANSLQQVAAWTQQYEQMVQQIQQARAQYNSISGIRNMGGLVNNFALRQYLPQDYQNILSQGVGQWQAIYNASKRFDISASGLAATGDAARAFNLIAKQAAINRAVAEEGYSTASRRFADIQVLLDKVNAAPDAKDMADLQGRIQAEQVMMQNEANKLAMLQQLAQAQKDLQVQQAREISMKSAKGGLPSGW